MTETRARATSQVRTDSQKYGNRNLLINGGHNIHQRTMYTYASPKTVTATGYHGFDRWKTEVSGSLSLYQSSYRAMGGGNPVALFRGATGSLKPSLAAGDIVAYTQIIPIVDVTSGERFTSADVSSSTPLTVSFDIGGTAGTYAVYLEGDFAGDWSSSEIIGSKTVTATSTVSRYSVTFSTSNLSWYANLRVAIVLAAGSTHTASGAKAFGQTVNILSTSSSYVSISRVQLEQSATATDFEYRSYDRELAECQRYYWRVVSPLQYDIVSPVALSTSATTFSVNAICPVPMRAVPTICDFANIYYAQRTTTSTDQTVISSTGVSGTNLAANIAMTVASGLTANHSGSVRAALANAYLGVSAEL